MKQGFKNEIQQHNPRRVHKKKRGREQNLLKKGKEVFQKGMHCTEEEKSARRNMENEKL